jgi:hypothetical protein
MNPFPKHPAPLYIVRLDKLTPFRGRILEPESYVCDHVTLSLLSAFAVPTYVHTLIDNPEDTDGTTLVMPGVHGDLLMLSSIDGVANMQVACLPEYSAILEGVTRTVDLPCVYNPHRDYINLTHLTERPEVVGKSFVEGLRDMGLQVGDSLQYTETAAEKEFAETVLSKQTRLATRIAIQPFASARCRTYPHMGELLKALDEAFDPLPEIVFLCDEPLKIPDSVKHRVLQTANMNCTIRQAISIMARSNVLICPDSVFQHAAGALGVPTVALFGPFHWTERVLNRESTRALQGTADCGPCRHHAGSAQGRNYPDDPRCSVPTTGFCKAMASITPERIVTAVKQILEKGSTP